MTIEGREFKPVKSPFIIPRLVAALGFIAVTSIGLVPAETRAACSELRISV